MGTKEKREHHSYKRGGRPKSDEASIDAPESLPDVGDEIDEKRAEQTPLLGASHI